MELWSVVVVTVERDNGRTKVVFGHFLRVLFGTYLIVHRLKGGA